MPFPRSLMPLALLLILGTAEASAVSLVPGDAVVVTDDNSV